VLQVHFGDCRLTASWWATLLTLAGVLLFGSLGLWQWHRAEEKRALAAAFVAGDVDFSSELGRRSTGALPRFTQLRVQGSYESAHQFLLDNMTHTGQAGYQVLTPLRLDDGRLLLVNRGWVPLPRGRRDVMPDVALPDSGAVNVGGRIDELPVAGLAMGRVSPSDDAVWPKRTSFPSMAQLGHALGQNLEPRQLLLNPGESGGYLRDWQNTSLGLPAERHVAYAAQWWGLGALCVFLYLWTNLECRR
jgi:surfeit locus 1 family protein